MPACYFPFKRFPYSLKDIFKINGQVSLFALRYVNSLFPTNSILRLSYHWLWARLESRRKGKDIFLSLFYFSFIIFCFFLLEIVIYWSLVWNPINIIVSLFNIKDWCVRKSTSSNLGCLPVPFEHLCFHCWNGDKFCGKNILFPSVAGKKMQKQQWAETVLKRNRTFNSPCIPDI